MLCECIRQRVRILARERRDILKLMEEIGLIMPLPPVVEDMDPYDIDPVDQPWARLHRLSRGSRKEDSGEDLIFVLSIYCRYGTSDPAHAIVRANKEPAYLCTPMAYNKSMEFIESHIFEKQVNALLSDDEFALFQGFLFSNPRAGALIQQTGGLRKVRWAVQGKGKSGGVRVIYFYVTAAAQIRLIAIYKKGVKDDLSAAEKKILKKLNENW